MNMEAREKLVAETTESIFSGFSKSVSRVAALFETPDDALDKFIIPELQVALKHAIPILKVGDTTLLNKGTPVYNGEIRNLSYLLGQSGNILSFEETIKAVYSRANMNNANFLSGDYVLVSAEVPAVTIDGYKFDAVSIKDARLVVMGSLTDAVLFNFEDILLRAPIEYKGRNEGGFSKSLLAKYLNEHFLEYLFGEVKQYLLPNKDGLKVSLPTRTEVFGSHEEYPDDTNWTKYNVRHSYFKKCVNRVKVEHDDPDNTWFFWTSTPYSGTSYNAFIVVDNGGSVGSIYVCGTGGGVSPVICVAKQG